MRYAAGQPRCKSSKTRPQSLTISCFIQHHCWQAPPGTHLSACVSAGAKLQRREEEEEEEDKEEDVKSMFSLTPSLSSSPCGHDSARAGPV